MPLVQYTESARTNYVTSQCSPCKSVHKLQLIVNSNPVLLLGFLDRHVGRGVNYQLFTGFVTDNLRLSGSKMVRRSFRSSG